MKQSKIIAITGSIASGKSQVTNFLKQLYYKVIDSDIISRDIINEREVIEKIKSYFGEIHIVRAIRQYCAGRAAVFLPAAGFAVKFIHYKYNQKM